ncbi:hypothetical protein BB560_002427 [Smittium megazygosporum]|uniref:Telomerase reverse transcriptase n=1 Tax=Smittium megazygosporum TaxID=133381 RepID=A0A2T9ZEU9_9FUNG|nr:hypothetical protein BB560_002427 [Smittium megazygosporum]
MENPREFVASTIILPEEINRSKWEVNLERNPLSKSIIVCTNSDPIPASIVYERPMVSQEEKSESNNDEIIHEPSVSNIAPNPIISSLKSEVWEDLLGLIGTSAMVFLLTRTFLFEKLNNNCVPLSQISSGYLDTLHSSNNIHLIRKKIGSSNEILFRSGGNEKKTRLPQNPLTKNIFVNCTFSKYDILYGKPNRNNNGKVIFGLPKYHSIEFDRITLVNQIFCKFEKNLSKWRRKKLLEITSLMIKLHSKTDYSRMILNTCTNNKKNVISLKKKENVFLESSNLKLNTITPTVPNDESFTKKRKRKTYDQDSKIMNESSPFFLPYSTGYKSVYRFITLSLNKQRFSIVNSNLKIAIKVYIQCGKGDIFSLHQILQNLKNVDEALSVDSPKNPNNFFKTHKSKEYTKQPKGNFYITETELSKSKVFYFRHDVWLKLTSNAFVSSIFSIVPVKLSNEKIQTRSIGVSSLRLIPKSSGLRPLIFQPSNSINFGTTKAKAVNKTLQPPFHKLHPNKFGCSVFGNDNMHKLFLSFKLKLSNDYAKFPKLFIAKVDITQAFTNIYRDVLIKFIDEFVDKDIFLLNKYALVRSVYGMLKTKYECLSSDMDSIQSFKKFARSRSINMKNSIFFDGMNLSLITREDVLQLINEHINQNYIMFRSSLYRQSEGIPQGSILSPLLCNLYFGMIENEYIIPKFQKNCLIMRQTDDYLFVSTEQSDVGRFLHIVYNDLGSKFGINVNKSKTLVNFDHEINNLKLKKIESVKGFPWCGFLINQQNLSIRPDYARFTGIDEFIYFESVIYYTLTLL